MISRPNTHISYDIWSLSNEHQVIVNLLLNCALLGYFAARRNAPASTSAMSVIVPLDLRTFDGFHKKLAFFIMCFKNLKL